MMATIAGWRRATSGLRPDLDPDRGGGGTERGGGGGGGGRGAGGLGLRGPGGYGGVRLGRLGRPVLAASWARRPWEGVSSLFFVSSVFYLLLFLFLFYSGIHFL